MSRDTQTIKQEIIAKAILVFQVSSTSTQNVDTVTFLDCVNVLLKEKGKGGGLLEDKLICLSSIKEIVNGKTQISEDEITVFVDRVAWDLAKEICQPTLSSLSPEVNMLRRDIMSLLATKGDARELFTALLELLEDSLRNVVSLENSEEEVRCTWGSIHLLLDSLCLVFERLRASLVDHFFEEASSLLQKICEASIHTDGGISLKDIPKGEMWRLPQWKPAVGVLNSLKNLTLAILRVKWEHLRKADDFVHVPATIFLLQLMAISVPLLCKEEVKDLQSSLLFPLKLSGFSVPCTNIKQKAYDLVSSLKNSMSLDDCNTMEDQETMERRVYLGLSMAAISYFEDLTKIAELSLTEKFNIIHLTSKSLSNPWLFPKSLSVLKFTLLNLPDEHDPQEYSGQEDVFNLIFSSMPSCPPHLGRECYLCLLLVFSKMLSFHEQCGIIQSFFSTCSNPLQLSLLLAMAKDHTNSTWPSEEKGASLTFFGPILLSLISDVLKPAGGDPPDIVSDAPVIASALNSYRFLLIKESLGGTNHTGCCDKNELTKAKKEWLMPLRQWSAVALSQHQHETQCTTESLHPRNLFSQILIVDGLIHCCLEKVEELLM